MYAISIMTLTPVMVACAIAGQFSPKTTISIEGTDFLINGKLTYQGCDPKASGRLMNVRMVNSTFDDENPETRPAEFKSHVNTARFIASMNEYKSKGILAFTLNLQGGFPGYEEAINSAFRADATLKTDYMNRVSRVIEAADDRGMVIILGFFYQRQDERLPDADAVRKATANAAAWIRDKGYTNVMVEIANEYKHPGFDHRIIMDEDGEVELMNIVRSTAPGLLVSTAGMGNAKFHPKLCEAADFILLHGNTSDPDEYSDKIGAVKKYGKPIIFNEDWCFSDDSRGVPDAVQKLTVAFEAGASWGIMNQHRNQHWPFTFGIGDPEGDENAKEDFAAYEAIAKLVGIGDR